jgi:hypothetical protein
MDEPKIVKLAGTEVQGVERRDEYWATVTYAAKEPEPSVHGQVCGALADMRDEITENICQLTDLLSRLRRLHIAALDGDADAIAEAQAILYERSFVDEDAIWRIEGDVEQLQELVDARSERRAVGHVGVDALEITVRDVALPYIEAGEYVQVKTHNVDSRATVTGANVSVEKDGHYITILVYPTVQYAPPAPPPPGTTVETAYQKVVELRGDAAAAQIRKAVESVEKDPAKQAAMLWKAVGA